MTKTVVFLGAGASKAFGLPLTGEILPRLLTRLMSKTSPDQPLFGGDNVDQSELKRCFRAILPGLRFASGSKGQSDRPGTLPLITDVLSAIDHFLISANGPSPGFTLSRLARARTLLERAVFELWCAMRAPMLYIWRECRTTYVVNGITPPNSGSSRGGLRINTPNSNVP